MENLTRLRNREENQKVYKRAVILAENPRRSDVKWTPKALLKSLIARAIGPTITFDAIETELNLQAAWTALDAASPNNYADFKAPPESAEWKSNTGPLFHQ